MGDVVKLLRVGVAGAAGLLGRELLSVLERRSLPVVELVPIGSEASLGDGVDFQGQDRALRPPGEGLADLDLLFLCAPAEDSVELARRALHARVPCLDLSGGLSGSEDVPLLDADADPSHLETALRAPLISVAGGPALAWSRLLKPLAAEAGLERVQVTGLESASTAGHRAVSALSVESAALLNQQEGPDHEASEPVGLPWPLAFDCHPATDEADLAGRSGREAELNGVLTRLLAGEPGLVGSEWAVDCTVVRIPTFSGEGAVVSVDTARPISADQAAARLAKVAGVEVVSQDRGGLRTRASTGRETILVGRVREATAGSGLVLWLTFDTQRLTALNAVRLAELRQAAGPAPVSKVAKANGAGQE